MDEQLPAYKMTNAYDGYLTVRSIKRQIDGALGSHGAWLLEDYADHDSAGLVLETVEDITGTAEVAIKHGYQVNTHAIGDRANREVLDIYEKAFAADANDGKELRWRIEHAQHIDPDDIPRFFELGVIAAMQGIHCTSDAPWVYKRLGDERAESGAYMWRDLLDSQAPSSRTAPTSPSKMPIRSRATTPPSHASRKTAAHFFPDQAMTREEALESYTLSNAYAAFEEDVKGSITPGKYADITVLSKDILTIPAEEILETEVVYTIVGGDVLHAP